ncbi:alpha/beta-hydrolase [Dentipellis sp. KUC8613]|nr:alpha/beta-hydrolase [Dentipellis sp. KUC8613]
MYVHSRLLGGAAVLALVGEACANVSSSSPTSAPVVKLDNGTFTGRTSDNVNEFLGIPFALPPIGDLRFRLPVPHAPYTGTYNATAYGFACPQQDSNTSFPALPPATMAALGGIDLGLTTPENEDCLTVNVIAPANASSKGPLPVLVYIYGGAFEIGATAAHAFNGSVLVNSSIALGEPIVFVSMNYRLNAFGFLASQEVKDAGVGNLGLQDQREALRWVQKYIHAFGGDPSRVTIYGISAGSISVALQMMTNGGNTEGLFHAGFMESGTAIPVGDISHGQHYYDALVNGTGCSGSQDTLECLRHVPYDQLKPLVDQTPSYASYLSANLVWLPRVDGVFLKDTPTNLVSQGSVAAIPMINGDADDEGTFFCLFSTNITTDEETRDYLQQNYFPSATEDEINQLLESYPSDPAQGSPFDTGDANAFTPQFKRLSAFTGDFTFQAQRRSFLQQRSGKQPIWSYLSKRNKQIPVLGSFHTSEVGSIWGPGDMTGYFIRFVAHGDPNGGTDLHWPDYTAASPQLLTLWDGPVAFNVTQDTYRASAFQYLDYLSSKYPL